MDRKEGEMNDETIYVTELGRTMCGIAVIGTVVMLAGAVIVIGGGITLLRLIR